MLRDVKNKNFLDYKKPYSWFASIRLTC